MKLLKAKSIDDLYEEVRGYDYVVTNDAALATALNAMVCESRLDGFAFTPKMIASMMAGTVLENRPLSDLEVVEKIEYDTGLDFRFIHSEMENIRDIQKYTAEVENYLYSERAKDVLASYREAPTVEKVMAIFDGAYYNYFLKGRKVAVIGIEFFNDLDKHMLPPAYDVIDMFVEGEKFEIGTIYGIGNDRQIAGSIVDLIERDTANDTAIVLDPHSPVADAVRSALYRKKIPFKNELNVKDLAQVRDFLQFLTLALDYDTIRVKDIRELFSGYLRANTGRFHELMPNEDNYLVSRYPVTPRTEPVTAKLLGTMKDIRDFTFAYVAEILYQGMPQLASVLMLLRSVRMEDRKVTSELVERLSYTVNNVEDLKHNEQIPDDEKYGVLLADCRKATYVDRSFVIFIGLDESWEVTASGKEYVDKEQLDEDSALRMMILLQQGTTRIYAVKPASDGKKNVPCVTFQTVSGLSGETRSIERFEDICSDYRLGSWFVPRKRDPVFSGVVSFPGQKDKDWKFSKTHYNAYRDCPIEFIFSNLLTGEDNEHLLLGNCLHNFAELYFCYPDLVREKGPEYFLKRMEEEYAGISSECQKPLDISMFRVYSKNIMRYIDTIRPAEVPLDMRNAEKKYPNPLFADEGLEMCSSMAEATADCDYPLFAKYDLCIGSLICDYKTGKPKNANEIIKGLLAEGRDLSEFQPMVYLAAIKDRVGNRCEFDLFFAKDNDIASVDDGFDISRNVRRIIYSDQSIYDLALCSGGILHRYYDNTATYAKFAANWDDVCNALRPYAEMGNLRSEAAESAILNAAGLKDGKTNRTNAQKVIRKVADMIDTKYAADGTDTVIVSREAMGEFLSRIAKDRETALEQMKVPIYDLPKGRISCDMCGYRKVCLKAYVDEEVSE